MAKLDLQVFLKKMQGALSARALAEVGRVGTALALGSGGKGSGEMTDQLVEQDGPPNAELDFRKLELLIQEMAKAKAAGTGGAGILGSFLGEGSSLEDSVEFFDCQELVEAPPGPKPSPKTSLRLRFHLGEFALALFEKDESLITREGTAIKAHFRDLSVVTVAGGAKASIELSVQEVKAVEELVMGPDQPPVVRPVLTRWVKDEEEEGESRPSTRRSRRGSSLSSSQSSSLASQGPFLKASMDLVGKQEAEEHGEGPAEAKTIKIALQPFRSELPLTSIRRWLAVMSPSPGAEEAAVANAKAPTPRSQRGTAGRKESSPTQIVVSCPNVYLLLPFSDSLLDMPCCTALRHAMAIDEVERARWNTTAKTVTSTQSGFTFLLDDVRLALGGDCEENVLKLDWATANVLLGFGQGQALEVLKVGQRKAERPFFRIGCYGDRDWKQYVTSLEETETPDLSAWETVDRDGGLLRIEPRQLPTSKALPLTHLHLADVSVDLTKVEKMAVLELVSGVFAAEEPEAVTQAQDSGVEGHPSPIVGSPFALSSGDALLVLHETEATMEVVEDNVEIGGEDQEEDKTKKPLSYTAIFEGVCIYSVGLRANGSHFRAASADFSLTEAENHSDLSIVGRCHSQHRIWGQGRPGRPQRLTHQPLVYKNKWAVTPASAEALLVLDLIREGEDGFPGGGPGPLSIFLDLRCASFRYQVDSVWLPRFTSLLMSGPETLPWIKKEVELALFEQAHGEERSVQSTLEEAAARLEEEQTPPPPPTMTKLFCTALDTTVDYTAGVDSRTVINLVFFRISSNLVGGAGLQGYKIMAQDLALHMINQGGDYLDENEAMIGSYLLLPEGEPHKAEDDEESDKEERPGSAHQYLERRGFVQLATLNFVDAFVRCQVGGPPKPFPNDPMVNVELSMGLLHVYTCGDSLQTLQQTFGQWWAHITDQQQQQPQPTLPLLEAARQSSSSSIRTTETTGTVSLEPMIKEDKFVPEVTARPLRASPPTAQPSSPRRGSGASLCAGGGLDLSKVMLVEDYYTVGQQPVPPLPSMPRAYGRGSGREEIGRNGGVVDDDAPEWQGGWIADDSGSLRSGVLGQDGDGFLLEVMEDEASVVTELEDDDDNLSVMSGRLNDVPVYDDDSSECDGAVPGSLFNDDMEMEMGLMGGRSTLSESSRGKAAHPLDDDPLAVLAGMEAETEEEEEEQQDEAKEEGEDEKTRLMPVPLILPTQTVETQGKSWLSTWMIWKPRE